jgi:autotransporter adhesin
MNKLLTMISAVALLTAIAGSAYADQHEKTVFVTSAKFKGNLGGLAGADDKCQAEADGPASIVPSGTYLAWLSDGTDSPDTRFTKSAHPYMLLDGTKIAENYTDLTDGSILHAINIDSTGKALLGVQQFWTGTKADGTTSQNLVTCDGWTSPPGAGFRGRVGSIVKTSTSWSAEFMRSCDRSLRLACFQQ